MARSPERPGLPPPPTEPAVSAVEPQETSAKPDLPASPTRSDKSSDSEGRPVREKLQETRIDAQSASDPVPGSDLLMDDVPNGTSNVKVQPRDQSPSGSESERGRLRRKRSREDFEDDHEAEKHPEKKERHAHSERHTRKKSRDVTSPKGSDVEVLTKPTKTSVPPIHEHDADEAMPTVDEPAQRQSISKPPAVSDTVEPLTDTAAATKAEEERDPKRPRDKGEPQPLAAEEESKTKIPPNSGFANTSVASPFAALAPQSQAAKDSEKSTDDLPQTSVDKFKSSGFGAFSTSSTSPFGGLGSTNSTSPFAAASGAPKITSFASSTSTSNSIGGGFASLGNSSGQSSFGGSSIAPVAGKSVFGGGLGSSAFGGLGGSKIGLPSFATPGQTTITGLSQKPAQSFGTQQKDADSDDETGSGGEDDDTNEGNEEKESSSGWKHHEMETGEEGEMTKWTGRAKLYTMRGEGADKQWQESGVGALKFNITEDEPLKARFVLRADGTHRLLLNAAVPKTMKFGDPQGKTPKDSGKLFFNSPTAEGKVEMYLLKLKAERAVELFKEVEDVKNIML